MTFLFVILGIILLIILFGTSVSKNASELGQTKKEYIKDFKKPIQERRGKQGELLVEKRLEEFLGEEDYLLHPLLIPYNKNGDTSEIDFVLISSKGLFCIEVKYLVGTIIGDEYSDSWEQIYNDGSPNKNIRNPFKQNENHISLLEKEFNYQYDFNNVVLIANDNNDISQLSGCHIHKIDSFKNEFNQLPDKINSGDVNLIKTKLEKYIPTEDELKAHKERIKRKYNRT